MKVTQDQLLDLLSKDGHPDAVWVMHTDGSTEVVIATPDELAVLQSRTSWPMYLVRKDHAENYIRQHGLDGAVKFLNLTFMFIPEPGSIAARVISGSSRLFGGKSEASE
ncbi:hypothetical protein [Rhodococcoides fascians]|uniref:hypothetical protein n=1 Tax=Rhodococcoides fascians TaxID=1828 RepID=UPI0012D2B94C|nr:hypothetical protein [Rhodococcus fascians]